jgi:monovalent cation:H+ antiporter-2, CPA2 family
MHDLTIIHMLAMALVFALAMGWLTQRLGLTPLVGYLLAGVIVGPYTPGFVADRTLASQLSEVGVVLLLFGVGLHFHPKDLLRVWRVAVPGAIAQSAVATILGWALARGFGWGDAGGIVLGMSLAVASTVVLSRMLMERKRLDTVEGQVAMGWLIVEDIFTVIALVVLPALAGAGLGSGAGSGVVVDVLIAVGKVALFAALALVGGRWLLSPLLERLARTGAPELFTLAVVVVAFSVAMLASEAFHVSVALGAFFAGLVVGQSRVGVQAAAEVAPFRDVFSALFFVSVGMLFDPLFLLEAPLVVVSVLAVVIVAKPLIAWLVVRLFGRPNPVALIVSVGLAQIGEFSFILAALGKASGILPDPAFNAIIAVALISIAINPLLFKAVPSLERRFDKDADKVPSIEVNSSASVRPGSIVIAGFGAVSKRFCMALQRDEAPFVVVDHDLPAVEEAAELGYHTCFGDIGHPEVLKAAGVAQARLLVLSEQDLTRRMRACLAARELNPDIPIAATVRHAGERGWLAEFGVSTLIEEDVYIAEALHQIAIRTPGAPA